MEESRANPIQSAVQQERKEEELKYVYENSDVYSSSITDS